MAKIGPGEEAGVVAVRKGEADGIVADRIDRADRDIGLARHRLALLGAVTLHLRRGAEDAQQFGGKVIVLAVIETDEKRSPVLAQADLGRPGLLFAQKRPLLVRVRNWIRARD